MSTVSDVPMTDPHVDDEGNDWLVVRHQQERTGQSLHHYPYDIHGSTRNRRRRWGGTVCLAGMGCAFVVMMVPVVKQRRFHRLRSRVLYQNYCRRSCDGYQGIGFDLQIQERTGERAVLRLCFLHCDEDVILRLSGARNSYARFEDLRSSRGRTQWGRKEETARTPEGHDGVQA